MSKYSGGLLDYITSNITTCDETLTAATFEKFVRTVFRYNYTQILRDPFEKRMSLITGTLLTKELEAFCNDALGFRSVEHLNSMLDVGGVYPRRPELVYSHSNSAYDLWFKQELDAIQHGRVIDISEKIVELEPDESPFMRMLMKLPKQNVSQKVDWLNDDLLPRLTTLAATAYTQPVGLFKNNDVVRVESTGELLVVRSVAKDNLYNRGTIKRHYRSGVQSSYAEWDLWVRNRYGYTR